MTLFGAKFTLGELQVFQSALTETSTHRIIREMVNAMFLEERNKLLFSMENIEEVRRHQGAVSALKVIDDNIDSLLAIDPEELVDEEVENDETEEETNVANVQF